MSAVWLTSDWHLGHKPMVKWRPGFNNIHEHDWLLLNNCRNMTTSRDIVWFLGDMFCGCNHNTISAFINLPCRKKLVMGNHDTDHLSAKSDITVRDFCDIFEEVVSIKKYKAAWFTHVPMHPEQLRGRINIHGHTHESNINDDRYYNVCPEQTDYKPVKYQDILAKLRG